MNHRTMQKRLWLPYDAQSRYIAVEFHTVHHGSAGGGVGGRSTRWIGFLMMVVRSGQDWPGRESLRLDQLLTTIPDGKWDFDGGETAIEGEGYRFRCRVYRCLDWDERKVEGVAFSICDRHHN